MSTVAVVIVVLAVFAAGLLSSGHHGGAALALLVMFGLIIHQTDGAVIDAIGGVVHRASEVGASIANGAVAGGREGLRAGGAQ